jgi:hypothetical protein
VKRTWGDYPPQVLTIGEAMRVHVRLGPGVIGMKERKDQLSFAVEPPKQACARRNHLSPSGVIAEITLFARLIGRPDPSV